MLGLQFHHAFQEQLDVRLPTLGVQSAPEHWRRVGGAYAPLEIGGMTPAKSAVDVAGRWLPLATPPATDSICGQSRIATGCCWQLLFVVATPPTTTTAVGAPHLAQHCHGCLRELPARC